jgi:hypothetical protein
MNLMIKMNKVLSDWTSWSSIISLFTSVTNPVSISHFHLVACIIRILRSQMTPLESSVSDATILNITILLLDSSIMLLENIYSTGVTHSDHHLTTVICL